MVLKWKTFQIDNWDIEEMHRLIEMVTGYTDYIGLEINMYWDATGERWLMEATFGFDGGDDG